MRHRRKNPDPVRAAERRYHAEPTEKNWKRFAKAAARAGEPLARFRIIRGGSIHEPHDPGTRECVWVQIGVPGRALPAGSGVDPEEWVETTLVQLAASHEPLAQTIVDALSSHEPTLLENWAEREDVGPRLRLSGADAQARIQNRAMGGAVFRDLFQGAGFSLWHTGRGCTAWGLVEGDLEALITGSEGSCSVPDADDEELVVGIYEDGELVGDDVEGFPVTRDGAMRAIAYARRQLGIR